jgi:hypothetical protein
MREIPDEFPLPEEVFERQRALLSARVTRQGRRGPSRRRGGLAAAFASVGAVAAVVFVVALLSPWDSRNEHGLVLERALAAVADQGPVLHAVFASPGGAGWGSSAPNVRLNLKTGALQPIEDRVEVWYDRERRLLRFVVSRDNHILVDSGVLGPCRPTAAPSESGCIDKSAGQGLGGPSLPGILSPFDETDYRDALAEGKAKVVGSGSWRGHAVYWLKLDPPNDEFGIDQHSYRLLVLREVDAGRRPTGREMGLLLFEYVPRAKAQFRPIGQQDRSGSGFSSSAPEVIAPAKARTALGVPAVWAGPSLDGLGLHQMLLREACPSQGPCSPGRPYESKKRVVQIFYGPSRCTDLGQSSRLICSPGPNGVEISEAPTGRVPAWEATLGVPPRSGFADLTSLGTAGGDAADDQGELPGSTRTTWLALLAVGDVWVTIDAPSRELAIAAARALRPIPATPGDPLGKAVWLLPSRRPLSEASGKRERGCTLQRCRTRSRSR